MATLARLFDFQPMTPIASSEVDAEFNQLVNALNGTSTGVNLQVRFSSATVPPLKLDQLGAGPIQQWAAAGVTVATLGINGTLTTSGGMVAVANIQTAARLISNVATGTSPLGIASTTLVANLNADKLDGFDSTAFAHGGLFDFKLSGSVTTGTSDVVLYSKLVPANTLLQDGDFIVFEIFGRISNDGGTGADYTFTVLYSSVTIHTEMQNTNSANQHYRCRVTLMRASASQAHVTIDWNFSRYGQTIENNGGGYQTNDQFSKVQVVPFVNISNWTANRLFEFSARTSNASAPILCDVANALKFLNPA